MPKGEAHLEVVTHSQGETEELGRVTGSCIDEPVVILVRGPLGAGKTVLARGIARGLGFEGYVRSPTFTLIHHYDGRLPVYHLDLYRLEQASQAEDLGFEEYFYGEGVCLVEWAERIEEFWPEYYLLIDISRDAEAPPSERRVAVASRGELPAQIMACVERRRKEGGRSGDPGH